MAARKYTHDECDIKYENGEFWVLDVGDRGFEVYRSGITHSTRVASIGRGQSPQLGLTRAIAEADRRQVKVSIDVEVH